MHALVRNRCEAELLALMEEVGKLLRVSFTVEVLPPAEGGWEDHLVLVGQHKEEIQLLLAIITGVLAVGGAGVGGLFLRNRLRQSSQQTLMNDLTIEKGRMELKRLKREDEAAAKKDGELALEDQPSSDDIARAVLTKKRVQIRRSNFYRQLVNYSKVEAVGFGNAFAAGALERVVERSSFNEYIVGPEVMAPTVSEGIEIEVVAPVLRVGSLNWRGIFERQSISFELADHEFQKQVLDQEVVFKSGTRLVCDLEEHLEEDEVGDIEVKRRVVTKVHRVVQVAKAEQIGPTQLPLPEEDVTHDPRWGQI
ncbi:hypothetical protein CDL60_14240 [Roseateles noduli]|nr:hypothetical protein CDL60_14240 [Roseateles noduli]